MRREARKIHVANYIREYELAEPRQTIRFEEKRRSSSSNAKEPRGEEIQSAGLGM
jgi:hypothetical protein